jgi:hypothetical protein
MHMRSSSTAGLCNPAGLRWSDAIAQGDSLELGGGAH